MVFNFDTTDYHEATAALLVYAVYRSRDLRRFKVTPDLWAQIERFVKASAKRATTLPEFLEALKPRLACGTLNPKWMETGIRGVLPIRDAEGRTNYIQAAEQREFMTGVIAAADTETVLRKLYKETTFVILLVRQRIEMEKPIETQLQAAAADDLPVGAEDSL